MQRRRHARQGGWRVRSAKGLASSTLGLSVIVLTASVGLSSGLAQAQRRRPDPQLRAIAERLFDKKWVARQLASEGGKPGEATATAEPSGESVARTDSSSGETESTRSAAAARPRAASGASGPASAPATAASERPTEPDEAPAPPGVTGEIPPPRAAPGSATERFRPPRRARPSRGRFALDDITNTIRLTDFHTMTVSQHDPDVAFVATWDGYVLKTVDGGKTWDESRLIVERRGFLGDSKQPLYFGSQRNDFTWGEVHRGVPLMHAEQILRRGEMRRLRDNVLGYHPVSPRGEGRIGESENRELGVGLPGRAPRLQNVVRRFGKPTAGLNIKQTLLLRGVMPSALQFIVIHPRDPETVFACSHFGLFVSRDGGLNWVRVWGGESPNTRMVLHLAVDPLNSDKVLMGTKGGLYISMDRGKTFYKSAAQGVGEGTINWIQYSPYDPKVVFTCTDYGLLRSKDAGKNWEWIYFTTFPAARVVRYVHIDPFDRQTGYVATNDGLFWTKNILTASLEDWTRLGGLFFTGFEMTKITADPNRKGHLWTLTNIMLPTPIAPGLLEAGGSYVLESFDGGHSWQVLFNGNTKGRVSWYENDPRDPELLWLVWTRSLTRLRHAESVKRGPQLTRARRRALRNLLRHEKLPPIGDVIYAGTRFYGFEAQRQLQYRARSRLRAWVPRVDLTFSYIQATSPSLLVDSLYLSALPFRYREDADVDHFEFRAILSWNLWPAVFTLEQVLFGRIDRLNGEARAQTERVLHRFYGEYVRLNAEMITNPPKDVRLKAQYICRLEELHSYLDFMTGGYLTRYAQGGKPSGWDTPWFKRWPGTGRDIKLN
jgi:hypothetical protein